jgi:hypothetical protein
MSELKFATRLNSFASGANLYWPDLQGKPSVLQMIARAGTVKGLTHLDLNYPQHITTDIQTLRQAIEDAGWRSTECKCAGMHRNLKSGHLLTLIHRSAARPLN